MNVSNGEPESLGTGVAAVTATNFPTTLRAAPMLAVAANLNLYRLRELMSESKFTRPALFGKRPVGDRQNSLTLPPVLAAKEAAFDGGSVVPINRRHQRPAEGPRR